MATNYSGNSTPTLNNAPASSWTDDAAKHSHVGNTYLVTGSGGTAGNVYAFEEYPTPLIKNASGLPADIVTITDGGENQNVLKAAVTLSPIQSLNGYDHPWAGGAGKNKLPPLSAPYTMNDVTFTPQTDGSVRCTGTATDFAYCTFPVFSLPAGSYVLSGASGWGTGATPLKRLIILKSGGTLAADYGSGATFNLTETAELTVRIDFGSGAATEVTAWPMIRAEGTDASFAPYENLCPISGHTQATLYRTGKNLLDYTNIRPAAANVGIECDANGVISDSSPTGDSRGFDYSSCNWQISLNAGTYCVSWNVITAPTNPNANIQIWDSSGNLLYNGGGMASVSAGLHSNVLAFTEKTSIGIICKIYDGACKIQIESGSTASGWEPYVGSSYPVSFPQTVYGGELDAVGGSVLITLGEVDLGSLSWTYYTGESIPMFYADISAGAHTQGSPVTLLCSQYIAEQTVLSANQMAAKGYGHVAVNQQSYWYRILVTDDRYTDAIAFKTAMNGVQLVYELASPTTLTLSPQTMQTLLGLNNLWADNGQISELQYRSNQFTPAWQWFETWTMPKITRDNGTVIVLPYPQEYTPEIYDVDAATTGRNAAGTMIRDRVARKHKFNYKFPPLSQADATEILGAVQDVSFTLTTASPETGAKTNYRVYVGDRSLPVYWMPTHDNASWLYSSLSLNLIEM